MVELVRARGRTENVVGEGGYGTVYLPALRSSPSRTCLIRSEIRTLTWTSLEYEDSSFASRLVHPSVLEASFFFYLASNSLFLVSIMPSLLEMLNISFFFKFWVSSVYM